MNRKELPAPPHFNSDKVGEVWRVDYQKIAELASVWAKEHEIKPANTDDFKICLIAVDVQNTFCIPDFELYVGESENSGPVQDNIRLTQFIYKNLHRITEIVPTMDTHQAMQIFHSIFFINENGEHPEPYTQISADDIRDGKWRFNRQLSSISNSNQYIEEQLLHYTQELKKLGKYELTVWPYHAMLGGIGHALVSSVEEALFFHTIARFSQPHVHVKGDHPLTEHYSVLGAEVTTGPDGKELPQRKETLFQLPMASHDIYRELVEFDAVIIAGQAKSHCVAWTIADLLRMVWERDEKLVQKVYLLEDCTSPVIVPGVIDYTEQANRAFQEFAEAGMNVVRSTDSITEWPGIKL